MTPDEIYLSIRAGLIGRAEAHRKMAGSRRFAGPVNKQAQARLRAEQAWCEQLADAMKYTRPSQFAEIMVPALQTAAWRR